MKAGAGATLLEWHPHDQESPMNADTQDTLSPEAASITSWRRELLEQAGCDPQVAGQIAEQFRIDLHEATAMLAAGCTSELLAAILL